MVSLAESPAPLFTRSFYTITAMPANEATPLLENGHSNGDSRHQFTQQLAHFFKTSDDEPTWLESYRYFFLGSYFNVLLVFIPLSFLSHWLDWDASLRFSFSFIAIMPLAKVCCSLAFVCRRMVDLQWFLLSLRADSCWVTPRNRCHLNSARL